MRACEYTTSDATCMSRLVGRCRWWLWSSMSVPYSMSVSYVPGAVADAVSLFTRTLGRTGAIQ